MGTSPNNRGGSKSPKQSKSNNSTPPRNDSSADAKPSDSNVKSEIDGAKPLGPPPRPGQTGNTPDYFGNVRGSDNNLNLEPNPFEQSFGGGSGAETPGGTKLPPVAHITSPSALLPGTGTTPFNWGGGSLRTGPLSPAMLSGPASDYFDTHTLRGGGFPTPNESSLRTGLTPGGSGSMFPAPSPNSQLFAQLASGGVTPSTLDFHRTAVNAAAAAKREGQNQANNQNQASLTSQPQDMPNGVASSKAEVKPTGPFDPHDNDAANGLFMLAQGAQGRNGAPPAGYPNTSQAQAHGSVAPAVQPLEGSPPMQNGAGSTGAGSSNRGGSEGSDELGPARPNTRGKGKKNGAPATTNGRRKAEDAPAKGPASKKVKTAAAPPSNDMDSLSEDEDEDGKGIDGQPKSKMTDEEKRKNFLERNRVAALKCRQRKKQWLANLQSKVEMYSAENDSLTTQINALREEVVSLKTLLLAHKDCPVTQQQGLHTTFMQQPMEAFNPQMNPYGMAGPMPPNQQVMAGGQGVPRRFS